MASDVLLHESLAVAVPVQIAHYCEHPDELALAQAHASYWAQDIAEHGDALLFRSRHSEATFIILVRALAMLAFAPGGVTVFGLHFEAKP